MAPKFKPKPVCVLDECALGMSRLNSFQVIWWKCHFLSDFSLPASCTVRRKGQNLTKFGHDFSLFTWIQLGSLVVSANDNETACVNEGRPCLVCSKSPSVARAVEEIMSKETEETWLKPSLKSWRLQNLMVTIPAWNEFRHVYQCKWFHENVI